MIYLNGEKPLMAASLLAATAAPIVSVDLATFVNAVVGLAFAMLFWFIKGWYNAVEEHVKNSEKRFDALTVEIAQIKGMLGDRRGGKVEAKK